MIELGLKHGDRGLNFIGDRLHMKGGSVHSLGLGVCWCGLGSHSIVFGLHSFVLGSGLHSSGLVRVGGKGFEGGGEVVVPLQIEL